MYIKNTSIGTTTNEEGYYRFKVSPGKHQIIYQFTGYKIHTEIVDIISLDGYVKGVESHSLQMNVQLNPEIYKLKEVLVKATDEDPAYRIIRNAIKKRKYHLNEIESYSCKVYIKGLQRLHKVPKNLLGLAVNIDTGIVYFSESVSKLFYKKPDKFKERMIASKVSGDNKAFSFNQASQMMINFYKNIIELEGLNERGFVSPIASNALLYYRYRLIGSTHHNDIIINKIKVTPIRKNDPAFSGYIYIVEDSWRLQSVNLLLSKGTQIEFLDNLIIKQVFAPVQDNIWMILSQKFTFALSILGFKGSGYFVAVYSNYKVIPNLVVQHALELQHTLALQDKKNKNKGKKTGDKERGTRDMEQRNTEKKFINNEIMVIEKQSNKRDSVYWNKIRPVPLTIEEVKDYKKKDSIKFLSNTKQYRDSVDKRNNRFSIGDVLYGGYSYYNSYKKNNYSISPLIQNIQFNTIEGFTPNLYLEFSKEFENRKFLTIEPALRYGFSNKHFNATLATFFYYNAKRHAYISAESGRFIYQFNANEPISPFINSLYSLFTEQNFLKIYEKSFIRINHRTEITNGFLLTTSLEYAKRKRLDNTTNFTLIDDENREYTSNLPDHPYFTDTTMYLCGGLACPSTTKIFIFDISMRIRFKQKYYSWPDRKIIIGSKFPTLTINYKKSIPEIFNSDADFDFISLLVYDDISLKLLGSGYWNVSAGTFLNKNKIMFMDYKHFMGNQTLISKMDQDHFNLMDYYTWSTTGFFVEGHYEHHFNGFVFNKFPLLRRLKFQVVASINYLYTGMARNYLEAGIGIEHIFKIGRIDFVSSFQQGKKTGAGVRIGIGF